MSNPAEKLYTIPSCRRTRKKETSKRAGFVKAETNIYPDDLVDKFVQWKSDKESGIHKESFGKFCASIYMNGMTQQVKTKLKREGVW